jgi:putative nucleotidyltransferase with HDIG domain
MDEKTASALRKWFLRYGEGFRSGDLEDVEPINLKVEHTKRVCEEIKEIGRSLGLKFEDLLLAEVMALFHDIGRFEQYARYRTFADSQSENHATLGVRVLRKEGPLEGLAKEERHLILAVIAYHNRYKVPEGISKRCAFFSKLLRDADKLDIWRVVTDYYNRKDDARDRVVELGLPDTDEVSDQPCADLLAGKIARLQSMRSLNDFKVLQMSWVYDVNFRRTFQRIQERGYMEMLRDSLPETAKVAEVYAAVQAYVKEKASEK